jgi:choloylglycine hydrolase
MMAIGLKLTFVLLTFVLTFLPPSNLQQCTTFLLRTPSGLVMAHSLDHSASVPGLVFLNQRNEWKKGFSLETLLTVDSADVPSLVWESRFGSVTFNPFGKDFPDGGINEAGLFIWEMTLVGTAFPDDPDQPKLFMMQWMQYVLDNFSTVDEVIDHAGRISIDGWDWHFFVADASGKTAAIEFLSGRPVIHAGEAMPIPLLTNSEYATSLEWLNLHRGFGGEAEIIPSPRSIPRFAFAAKRIEEMANEDPVAYAFEVLSSLNTNSRWAVVIDLERSRVHYRTDVNQLIRSFTFAPEDFGGSGGLRTVDIDAGHGDVKAQFQPFDDEQDRRLMESFLELWIQSSEERTQKLLDDQDIDVEGLARVIQQKKRVVEEGLPTTLTGEWTGTVIYPASGGRRVEEEMTLTLVQDGRDVVGTISDGVVLQGVPIGKTRYNSGLLTFAVPVYEGRELLYFKLHHTGETIKGAAHVRGDPRRAPLELTRVPGEG